MLINNLKKRFLSTDVINKVDFDKIGLIQSLIADLKLSELSVLVENLKDQYKVAKIDIPQSISAIEKTEPSVVQKVSKTEFSVLLQKIDPANKAKIIREIKVIHPTLNLVEAKNFVESAPKLIKDKLKQNEADAMKKLFESLGAQITIE